MLTRHFTDLECLNNGIVPLTDVLQKDVGRILDSLPPDEARKMKRKFRKLWRIAADAFHPVGKGHRSYSTKGSKPVKFQRKNRKLVAMRLMIQLAKQKFQPALMTGKV